MGTRASSPRYSCRDCARTLGFNRSNKSSIGFKCRLFEDHLNVCMLFASSITGVRLAAWHDQHHTEIRIRSRRNAWMTSFWYLIAVIFPWMVTLVLPRRFRVHKNALVRSVILIFAIFNVFHNRQSTRNNFQKVPGSHMTSEHEITYVIPMFCLKSEGKQKQ